MTQIQFQYTRLPHQDAAVTAIADVFADVHFYAPEGSFDNPHFKPHESHKLIKGNIEALRAAADPSPSIAPSADGSRRDSSIPAIRVSSSVRP